MFVYPFFQKPRVKRIMMGNISRRPMSIRKEQTILATGERIAH